MITVAVELSRALVANRGQDEFVLLCSRERPSSLADLDCEAVLAPYRHELVLKSRWLPTVEPLLECDAILYPYWPSPPFRRPGAPPAAIFVHDLAFWNGWVDKLGAAANMTIDKLATLQKSDGSWVGEKRWMEDNPVLVTAYTVLALQEAAKDLSEFPPKQN